MIPNAGLDNIAAYNAWNNFAGSSTADSSGTQWLAYAAISEDSTEPQATDLNIGTEKMRTNSTGGFTRTATAIRDPGTNRLGLSIERAYVFNITSSMNITKYGYVPVSSGGNFSWIDLMRVDPDDPESAPVTLNLVDGDQLQLWCTLTITVPWSVDLESFVITGAPGKDGVGTHDAYCGFFAANDTLGSMSGNDSSILNLIRTVFWPTGQNQLLYTSQASPNSARDAALGPNTAYGFSAANCTLATYVSGTYYRDKLFKLTTAEGNATLTAVSITAAGGTLVRPDSAHGFKVVFSDPSTFVKANTHELTLTFRVSWQEATA